MSASEEASSMETTDFFANMSTFIFIGVMIVFGVLFMLVLAFVCKDTIKEHIMFKLKQFKNETFFGNTIKAQTGTYLKTAISFIVFMRTINFQSGGFKVFMSLSPALLVFVYPVGVVFLLIYLEDKLGTPAIR